MIYILIALYIFGWLFSSSFYFWHLQTAYPSIADDDIDFDIGMSLLVNLIPFMWFMGFGYFIEFLIKRQRNK